MHIFQVKCQIRFYFNFYPDPKSNQHYMALKHCCEPPYFQDFKIVIVVDKGDSPRTQRKGIQLPQQIQVFQRLFWSKVL